MYRWKWVDLSQKWELNNVKCLTVNNRVKHWAETRMPDSTIGARPVVRRVSATQKDLISRFERPLSSTSSSVSSSGANTPNSLVSRSRAGSLKKTSVTRTSETTSKESAPKEVTTRKLKTKVSLKILNLIKQKDTLFVTIWWLVKYVVLCS